MIDMAGNGAPRPSSLLASPAAARARQNSSTKELRIGLVCYGGISLAVYMHGITKEVQKLVTASEAYAADPSRNPFKPDRIEHFYWQALDALHKQRGDGVRTRVIVDVVAGASAGGINGIFLGKGLARNRPQDALRDLWFERADLKALSGGSLPAEIWNVLRGIAGKKAPFNGDHLYEWLVAAFHDMETKAVDSPFEDPAAPQPASLVADGHDLDLFVTVTDYYGERQELTITDPVQLSEQRFSQLLAFSYSSATGASDFTDDCDPVLAFAARATSSFPVAFEPFDLTMANALLEKAAPEKLDPAAAAARFFPQYAVGTDDGQTSNTAAFTRFIDGGVLNNHPFQPVIDTILDKRAEAEVNRFLLYLEPAPEMVDASLPKALREPAPNVVDVGFAALTAMGNKQPILEEVLAVRDFNARVDFVASIVEGERAVIDSFIAGTVDVRKQLAELSPEEIDAKRQAIEKDAKARAGYLYKAYLRVRADSVLAQFAAVLRRLGGYAAESSEAALIALIVGGWAVVNRYAGAGATEETLETFLGNYDIGYAQRRRAFVIPAINRIYQRPGGIDPGLRIDLNLAKAVLYEQIDQLETLSQGQARQIGTEVKALFARKALGDPKEALAERARVFVESHAADLSRFADALAQEIVAQEGVLAKKLYDAFAQITHGWDDDARAAVLTSYVGFPYWDMLVYPVVRLSRAGELHPIQVVRCSPADSTRLGYTTAAEKLKGLDLGHFGAFLALDRRENDYLWGRLDAVERLFCVLASSQSSDGRPMQFDPALLTAALRTVLDEEAGALKEKPSVELLAHLKSVLDKP
jgi:patatin-related protein